MKRYIITGGSDGLGAEFGKICIKNEIEVVCLSRNAPDYPAKHIKADLLDQSSIDAAIETIKADFPKFDALVNCAGMITLESPDAITFDNLSDTMTVNLIAPAYLTSGLFKLIKENDADVVNVGSTVGTKAYPDQAAYGASKWGIRGLTQNLALELKGTKSRVIQFSPGGFKSGFVQKFTKQDADLSAYMEPAHLAKTMHFILDLPKSVEVSEILINRK
jgi:NADP-dependent 3-hydroxy acid dehydrogenase YdfG